MSSWSTEGKILHISLYWEERKIEFYFAYSYGNKDYEIRDLPSLEPGWFEFEIFEYGVGVIKRMFFNIFIEPVHVDDFFYGNLLA